MSAPRSAPRPDPGAPARARRRAVPTAAAALAFVLAAAVPVARTLGDMNVPGAPHLRRFGMQDFRDAIYYPAVAFLAGRNPYDVPHHVAANPVGAKFPLYAPHTLVVHLPFALLPHRTAQLAHLAVNVVAMLPLAWLALAVAGAPRTPTAVPLVAAALLVSRPGEMAVHLGQSAPYVVAGIYLALLQARRRPWLAALGLALALTKPTFGAPVALLLLCRGDGRPALLGGGLAAAVSALALPRLVAAAGGVGPFLETVQDNYRRWGHNELTHPGTSVHRVDAYLLAGRLAGRPLHALEDAALMAALFALAAFAVWRLARAGGDRAAPLSAAVVCTATLTGTYHQTYDALVLAAPAVLVATRDGGETALVPPAARIVLGALLAVPALNYLASYPAIRALALAGTPGWTLVTTANAAAVLATFVGTSVLALRAARGPRAA